MVLLWRPARPALFPPAKLVHQLQDALADFKQLLARRGNHFFRQQLLRRNRFESRLRLVQMIERAFETGDGEGAFTKTASLGNAVESARQLRAGGLKFKDELLQVVVLG